MSLVSMECGTPTFTTSTIKDNINGMLEGIINTDFSGKPNGPITSTDSGQALSLTTNAGANAELRILDGYVTNTATGNESAAGHMMVLGLNDNIKRIGADFEMDSVGATTGGGALALVLWSEPLIYPGPVVDTEMHITFSYQTWNIGRFVGGSYTSYATGTYKTPLVSGKLYRVEVVIYQNRVFVLLPDGQVVETPNSLINTVSHAIPSWEVFENNASTDWKTKIKSIWADTVNGLNYGEIPTKGDIYTAITDTMNRSLTSASDYPPSAAGNVGSAVPSNSALINSALNTVFISPSSGKVVVEMTAKVNITSSGPLIWTLLITEAGISEARGLSSLVGDTTYNTKFLVSGLKSGQLYTAQWQHRMFSGAATIRLNRSGGEVATITVTPVS